MDVNLLSRLLKELIIDNDRIALPGIGYFQTGPMPAYFSNDGKTIYPPSKKISFKGDDRASGEILSKYYAEQFHIDKNTADTELRAFLQQLKLTLLDRKNIELPGLGKLRCTIKGEPYFVADNTVNGIFAQAFGFEPVTLKPVRPNQARPEDDKTHKEERPVRSDTYSEATRPGTKETRPAAADTSTDGKSHRIWMIILSIAAAIVIAAVILVLVGRSGHLDSLIYSDEELELIEQQSD